MTEGAGAESPIESRRAFRALFPDSVPPGRVARGMEREEAFTRLCVNHRGASLLVKGVRFGSGKTRKVKTVFQADEHPDEVVIEVQVPVRHNPQVHCQITEQGVRVMGVAEEGKPAQLGALHNEVVFKAIDAARLILPHYRGELWLDVGVADDGRSGHKIILFGVRTTPVELSSTPAR